ncbi:MAG: NYN domain-containing protein [Leptospiraceae bacterium]|nr:NYN domain-containing protein [Leptospiraceae bacterium]
MENNTSLKKIGVFYDGGFFSHVSNYYNYHHSRKSRLSISGLHKFIKNHVAQMEGVDIRYSQIVDSHYFRGRYSAYEAQNKDKLLSDRLFEDVLMKEGVVTHFLPLQSRGSITSEKGIDVWFALEVFELAIYKRFQYVVLIASDSDYIPLVRKLNTLGVKVMLLAWDLEYTDANNMQQKTTTSVHLLDEVTHPILMHNLIDDKTKRNDPIINNLFITYDSSLKVPFQQPTPLNFSAIENTPQDIVYRPKGTGEAKRNRIKFIKDGYGFIETEVFGQNLFFYYADVENCDFNDLSVGDLVEYKLGKNQKGECAVEVNKISLPE